MKKKILFIAVLALLWWGCSHQHQFDARLWEVSQLVDRNPDSALTTLRSMAGTAQTSDANHALYNLLMTKACYKLYLPTPADSDLAFSQCYFEQERNEPLLAETFYYRGMTLHEQGHAQQAMQFMKQGEQLAEKLDDDSLKSKYYESLCQLNDEAHYWPMMLVYAKKFLNHSIHINNVEYICRGFSHVAYAFDKTGEQDSSYIYLNHAMPLLSQMSGEGRAYILTNFAGELKLRGRYEEAKTCFLKSLQLKPMDNTYCGLGNVYYAEDSLEKAEACWAKAMAMGTANTRINVMRSMMEVMAMHQDYERAYGLALQVAALEDSVQLAAQTHQLAEIQHRYDQQVAENRYYRWAVGGLMTTLAALLAAIVLIGWHQRQVKSYQAAIAEERQERDKALAQIAQQKVEEQKNARRMARLKEKVDRQSQQVLRRLADGKAIYEALMAGLPMPPTPKDADRCLADYLAAEHNELFAQWMLQYEGLTPRLITYLALLSMGRSDADVMQQLGLSGGALRTMKSRLKRHQM